MRSKLAFIVGAFVFLLSGVLEVAHYFSLLNDLLGEQIAGHVSQRSIFLLLLAGLLVLIFAWFDTRSEARENPTSNASFKPALSAGATVAPIQTQLNNPITTQTVEIHNYSQQRPNESRQEQAMKELPRYNVKFLGLKQTKTVNLQQEVALTEDGLWAVKARFINQSVPGMKIEDYDFVRARVVFSDSAGREILSISKPIWFDHDLTDHVHFEVNIVRCLLLAVCGSDDSWSVPFITKRPAEYWEDYDPLMIDSRTLPVGQGALHIEIILVGENNVGLEPYTAVLSLEPNGVANF
jgi:hypothetical protein